MKRSVISKDNETKPDELDYRQEKKRKKEHAILLIETTETNLDPQA